MLIFALWSFTRKTPQSSSHATALAGLILILKSGLGAPLANTAVLHTCADERFEKIIPPI